MLSKHAPGCVSKHCPSCFQTRAMGTISSLVSGLKTWFFNMKFESVWYSKYQVVRRGSKNNRSPASGQDVTKVDFILIRFLLFRLRFQTFLMPTCAISTITIVQDAPDIITRLHLVNWRQWSFQKAGGNSVWQQKKARPPQKSDNAILKLVGHKLLKTEHKKNSNQSSKHSFFG